MSIYRRIWEEAFGVIPVDDNGISYEIHHIDGDHSNNSISNLQCVSISEHFDIHFKQGDWAACLLIAKRMNDIAQGYYDKQLISSISKRNNKKRVKNGTHNFLSDFHKQNNKHKQKELYQNGKHHFCSGQNERGKKSYLKRAEKWSSLDDESFLELLKTYSFYKTQKLRNGLVAQVLNGIILQAINHRHKDDIDAKNEVFNKLKEYHNVDEAYCFEKQQNKTNRRRRRLHSTKCD